ncbi:MAG: hypothetical protein KFF49_12490 [Bacteroidales bacterium]|nr:hypothetical protein [Bacteroidales bacterium]
MKKITALLVFIRLIFSCGTNNRSTGFKLGLATFSHETCTFYPRPGRD